MKQTILLFVILMFSISESTIAQKLKVVKGNVTYVNLPDEPLPADFTTYSYTFKGSKDALIKMNIVPSDLIKGFYKFSGMKRVEEGGHINLEITLGNTEIVGSSTDSREVKKGVGSAAKVYKEHFMVVNAFIPISYILTSHEGKVLEEKLVCNDVAFTYGKNKGYKSASAVKKAWTNNQAALTADGMQSTFGKNIISLEENLFSRFDYQEVKEEIEFFTLKGGDDESAFNKHVANLSKVIGEMKLGDSLDDITEKTSGAVEYFKKIQKTYDPKDKKQKKVFFASAFNLTVANLWLDNLESARGYHKNGEKVGIKAFRMGKLSKKIDVLEQDMQANEGKNRRYMPDLSSAASPGSDFKGGFVDVPGTGAASNSGLTAEGYMKDIAGNQYDGTFIFPSGSMATPRFGVASQKGVEFHYEKNGQKVVSDLNPKDITGFSFNGKTYAAGELTGLGTALMTKNTRIIYELKYASDKIFVMANRHYYYPKSKNDYDEEMIFLKLDSQDKIHNTGDAAFVLKFKKKMAAVYKDCPALSQMFLDGKFKNETDDHIRAAKQYTEECK